MLRNPASPLQASLADARRRAGLSGTALARVLLRAAAAAGLDRSELAEAGTEQGRADAAQWPPGTDPLEALTVEQARLGFDPTVYEEDGGDGQSA